ncbi:MAG: UrcA family protein [Pseudomonadota bacterium]
MKNPINLRNVALLAGAALFSIGAMAAPLDLPVTKTETVKYSVPDAATVDGATALYHKLQETAARVCGDAELAAGDSFAADSYSSCFTNALGKAVQQVGIPMVSAMHMQSLASGKLTSNKALSSETVASR